VIAVFGPTAVGKTAVALALAGLLRDRGEQVEAISADALAVYRGLEILTAAPAGHRLVGFVPVDREFSVGEYMPLAHAAVDEALEHGARPLVVGGTGLYLRAALADLSLAPPPPCALRRRLEAELVRRGPAALHAELAERAPTLAARIQPSDRSRIVRSLERTALGRSIEPDESELWSAKFRHPTRLIGLTMDRDELYRRVDARVDEMLAAGAADEVRRAVAAGASRTARKALGFEELLAGDIEAMKRRSRNYAKRQLTWMRKLPGVELVDVTGRDAAAVAKEIAA